ncbi:MAG: hypothetical protein LBJ58_04980 [Tannerellaceae bacterium]|jgi:hypothetical protein|nr:hypothetical protein [Tannerellaceae bacterium]
MRITRISIGVIIVFSTTLGSCNDKKAAEEFGGKQTTVVEEVTDGENATDEGVTGGDLTGESASITDLQGTLSYYPDYAMWGVRHAIPGTIDSVDLYLIKDGTGDMPADTSISVIFSGDSFLSDIKAPMAGLTIYYITNFQYKPAPAGNVGASLVAPSSFWRMNMLPVA